MFKVRVPIFCRTLLAALLLGASCVAAIGQRNNPYSANPVGGVGPDEQPVAQVRPQAKPLIEQAGSLARRTSQAAIVETSTPPTYIYKIGIGDVLFVNLKNAQQAAGYYTVRRDGSIDFALAGESPSVVGKTVAEIEEALADAITLYPDPQIEVRVREYGSHKIKVTGMAERTGERSLLREALPLFAIRAQALVDSNATKVSIRRSETSKVETFDLRDEKTGDVLIYPGDSVEFTADGRRSVLATSDYFYISGEVNSAGQKPFTDGMTLLQAVTAAGGAKGNPKKATLRRKGPKGILNVADYDLRAIRGAKATDPVLLPGDMIEIFN